MQHLFDAFWRAAAYCLHPRVIALSLLPLLIAGLSVFGFMFFFWESANASLRDVLERWELINSLLQWLGVHGLEAFRSTLTGMLVLAAVLPVVLLLSLLLVAFCMTPAIVSLVAQRRFPLLEKKRGSTLLQSAVASLGATLLALVLIVLSMPLWLIPPLVMILPPLIWGWLTYRVFGVDVLAEHASADERRSLLKAHRVPMLSMGVICGYLGAVPSLIWAIAGVAGIIFAPFVVLLALWLYTLVFAFSTAWFTHYALSALQAWRAAEPAVLIES